MATFVFTRIIFAVQILTDEDLGTDNWFDAIVFGMHIEFDCTVEGRGIGQGERRHTELLGAPQEIIDLGEGGQERIVGVDVEMSEHIL